MKNKQMETKSKSPLHLAGHLFSRVVCLGAVILICSSARAQNLFMSGWDGVSGAIYKFTPDGMRTTFALGLNYPQGLAFDGAGNLFVADVGVGAILKFTPEGVRTTFASGLYSPIALAFDSRGNLFVADGGFEYDGVFGAAVYKFTLSGRRSTVASDGSNSRHRHNRHRHRHRQVPVIPNGLAIDSA